MTYRILCAFLASLLFLGSCAQTHHTSSPHMLILPGADEDRRVMGTMGRLAVAGGDQDIAYFVLPARQRPVAPPVYFLAGGPAVSGIESFGGYAESFLRWAEFTDVVIVDQRGTDFARPKLDCPQRWDLPLDKSVTRDERINQARDLFKDCAALWRRAGVDLSQYNTRAYGDDVIAVADVLGHDQIQLVAFSYGTRIAESVLRRYESRVARALLAGDFWPGIAFRTPQHFDALFKRIDTLFRKQHPDAPSLLQLLEEAVNAMDAHPFQVDSRGHVVTIDGPALRRMVFGSLGSARRLEFIPALLNDIADGRRDDAMRKWLTDLAGGEMRYRKGPLSRRNSAQHFVTTCADGEPDWHRDRRRIGMVETVFGHQQHSELPEACDAWNVPVLPPDHWDALDARTPVLLIAGTLDNKTPMDSAVQLKDMLPGSTLLMIDNAGHGQLLDATAAVEQGIADFLRTGTKPPKTASIPPPRFVLPRS